MENIAIRVDNVSKTFIIDESHGLERIFKPNLNRQKYLKSLDEITFTVRKGEVLGIIGPNGSGKSTLLRIIAGIYKPDSGSVQVHGRMSPLLQLGLGFQGDLNARDNIIMNGMLNGISKSEIKNKVDSIIHYAEIEKFENLKLKHFSSGMRARLAFASAVQINPDILLIDEVLSVGDKDFQKKSYETFLSFKKNKKTILHVTHNMKRVSEISERVILLSNGKIVMMGNPNEVIEKYSKMNTKN